MAKGSSMGKDPSVSWVFNDWQGGTMTMTRHQKGCYMDLLTAQFNNGHLSLDEIKNVLGSDFGPQWPALSKKFKQDSTELWYNERLEFEIVKRKSFNQSRRDNLAGGSNEPAHMGNGKGKEKGFEIEKGKGKKEKIDEILVPPPESEFLEYCHKFLSDNGKVYAQYEMSLKSKYAAFIDNGWKDGHNNAIKNWKTKIQNVISFLKPDLTKKIIAAPANEKDTKDLAKSLYPTQNETE